MGLNNFTNTGSNGNGAAVGMPPMAPMASGSMDDITDMLIDYNDRFKNADPTLFRDQVIDQMISVLVGKYKPNPLLVGLAGVGKTKIVEDLARRIVAKDSSIPKRLSKSTVYELPLSALVAGAGIVGQLEERITKVIDFATDPANDAIIFIDEIHLLVDSRSTTYEKIAQILKPALARGDMRVIGATTLTESRGFDDDPAFARRFSRLIVDELDREQTTEILHLARPSLIAHYNNEVVIGNDVLDQVATIADQNSRADQHRPDNALTLLDRAMADALVSHKAAIAKAQAAGDTSMVAALTAVPVISVNEKRLVNTAIKLMTGHAAKNALDMDALKKSLSRIKGQDEAVAEICDAIRRDTLSVFPRTLPLAWMFPGSSGCGKTEVVKIISEVLTGQPPITLNMTEYIHGNAINRIIGSPAGYVGYDSNGELPFDTLESNPYRVVLLDEFEKADKAVQQLFLSALDEGYIKTSRGKVIDFSKAIVVATTNAARDAIGKPSIGFGTGTTVQSQDALVKKLSDWFAPELLGRFSKIVAFNSMTEKVYREVLSSSYSMEHDRIQAEQPRMAALLPASLPEDDVERITRETFIPSQGARPAIRAVRAYIEQTILDAQAAKATQVFVLDDDDEDEAADEAVLEAFETDQHDDES